MALVADDLDFNFAVVPMSTCYERCSPKETFRCSSNAREKRGSELTPRQSHAQRYRDASEQYTMEEVSGYHAMKI